MFKGKITFIYIGNDKDELESYKAPLTKQGWGNKDIPDSNIHEFYYPSYDKNIKTVFGDLFVELHEGYYRGSCAPAIIGELFDKLIKLIQAVNFEADPQQFRVEVDFYCGKYRAGMSLESEPKGIIKKSKPILENDEIKFISLEA